MQCHKHCFLHPREGIAYTFMVWTTAVPRTWPNYAKSSAHIRRAFQRVLITCTELFQKPSSYQETLRANSQVRIFFRSVRDLVAGEFNFCAVMVGVR